MRPKDPILANVMVLALIGSLPVRLPGLGVGAMTGHSASSTTTTSSIVLLGYFLPEASGILAAGPLHLTILRNRRVGVFLSLRMTRNGEPRAFGNTCWLRRRIRTVIRGS